MRRYSPDPTNNREPLPETQGTTLPPPPHAAPFTPHQWDPFSQATLKSPKFNLNIVLWAPHRCHLWNKSWPPSPDRWNSHSSPAFLQRGPVPQQLQWPFLCSPLFKTLLTEPGTRWSWREKPFGSSNAFSWFVSAHRATIDFKAMHCGGAGITWLLAFFLRGIGDSVKVYRHKVYRHIMRLLSYIESMNKGLVLTV